MVSARYSEARVKKTVMAEGGGVDLFLSFIRLANTEKTYFIRPMQNHRILFIEWEIFEMNSSEFNEPCHEIHQNSNNDNCHQETDC